MKEKLKILIIDTDRATRTLYTQVLSKYPNIEADEAKDGKEGVSKLKKDIPSIIVCDQDITGVSFSKFCETVRGDGKFKDIFLIVTSTNTGKENKNNCLKTGADEFLGKPVDLDQFLKIISTKGELEEAEEPAEETVAEEPKDVSAAPPKAAERKAKEETSPLVEKETRSDHTTTVDSKKMFAEMDILLIQDGGCVPGYNPVTAFICQHLEAIGREVFVTTEGFKSLESGKDIDFLRLVYDTQIYRKFDNIPGVFFAVPLTEARGALLRNGRYLEFLQESVQKTAAEFIAGKKIRAIIAIGDDGTFRGIHALCDHLPPSVQTFFIPVSMDSVIDGTDCIGQFTGVEAGTEKIRCYLADAKTYKRIYIIEMMGRKSGYHVLHSCIGAQADFCILPNTTIDPEDVVNALNQMDHSVIAVAQGYKLEQRQGQTPFLNAAEFFLRELETANIPLNKQVICEPFARDIRGTAPNSADIALAQRMALNVAKYIKGGTTRLMPGVQSSRVYAIPFHEIRTVDAKSDELLSMVNRL